MEKPLVTFAMVAYKQEGYIREAVQAALAQDYSPLAIILSDDCSPDNTFNIMQEEVSNYTGPHLITLNRNEKNSGLAIHINRVMQMVETDFLVIAAGDDVSLPHRTSKLVEAWLSSNKSAKSIHSLFQCIDAQGHDIHCVREFGSDSDLNNLNEHAHADKVLCVIGAGHAWDMEIIRSFPPLIPHVVNEDIVLPARAAMIGKVHLVPEILFKYRSEVGVSNEDRNRQKQGVILKSKKTYGQNYFCFVQKSHDFQFMGLTSFRKTLRTSRAKNLLPYWLASNKRLTLNKITFFVRRTGMIFLVKELFKSKFPAIVGIKRTIQFKLFPR